MSIKVRKLPDGRRELQISDQEVGPEVVERYVAEQCDAVGVMLFKPGTSLADVDFVRDLPGLESIRLNGDIRDCDAVFDVPTLRSLDLLHCRPPATVRFDGLPALESLDFAWGPQGGDSIASLPALRSLYLAEWNGERLPVGGSPALRTLRLEARPKAVLRLADLAGIADAVEELDVDSAVLVADGLSVAFSRLRSLTLESCRVPGLAFLTGAGELETVTLENCGAVPSLAPIGELPALRTLLIGGSTHIVDGDLEVLYRMPALREVALERGRPNYSRKPAEIRKSFPLEE